MSSKAKRLVVFTAACLAAVLAPGTVAYALWSTTATGTLTVTTASAVVAPPVGPIGCTGKNAAAVVLTWNAPSGPAPAQYQVYEGAAVLAQVTHPATTVSIPESALVGPGSHTVGVRSVSASGVESTTNPSIVIKKDNGGAGNSGRVSCQ
ncbi:MAG: hypothetical protein ACTHKG_05430 [Nocardioides sp.]